METDVENGDNNVDDECDDASGDCEDEDCNDVDSGADEMLQDCGDNGDNDCTPPFRNDEVACSDVDDDVETCTVEVGCICVHDGAVTGMPSRMRRVC